MRRRNLSNDEDEESGGWLPTYADMMTLLLCFFVLLISLSVFQKEQLITALNSLREGLGVMPKLSQPIEVERKSLEQKEQEALIKIAKEIEPLEQVTVIMTMKGLKIQLENPVLFATGEAELKSNAKEILSQISDILKKSNIDNEINISGHTDNVPIHTPQFPSNWELSTYRATNVLRYLIEEGLPPEKMSASGYGQYRPIASNKTKKGRSRNRRMEILILRKYPSRVKSKKIKLKK